VLLLLLAAAAIVAGTGGAGAAVAPLSKSDHQIARSKEGIWIVRLLSLFDGTSKHHADS